MIRLIPRTILLILCLFALAHPAHAQTQDEMDHQADTDFHQADGDLNKVYQQILTTITDPGTRQKFVDAQKAWVAFRDAQAAFDAEEAKGGTLAPMLRSMSLSETTKTRLGELQLVLGNLQTK